MEEKNSAGVATHRVALAEIDAGFLESRSGWTREVQVVLLWLDVVGDFGDDCCGRHVV